MDICIQHVRIEVFGHIDLSEKYKWPHETVSPPDSIFSKYLFPFIWLFWRTSFSNESRLLLMSTKSSGNRNSNTKKWYIYS